MIKDILNKTKHIISYEYDMLSNTFVNKSINSFSTLRDLVGVVNILSEFNIQFLVDKNYNINMNIINLKQEKAFIVSLDQAGNINDVNDVALEMSGYKIEELIGKNWFDLFIVDADKKDINKVFESVLSSRNNYWKHDNNIVLKDGSKKLYHWSNALIKDKKNNIATIHAFGVEKKV